MGNSMRHPDPDHKEPGCASLWILRWGPMARFCFAPAKSPRLAQARPLQVETIFPLSRDDIFRPRR
jgi:hypothetical protein